MSIINVFLLHNILDRDAQAVLPTDALNFRMKMAKVGKMERVRLTWKKNQTKTSFGRKLIKASQLSKVC